MRKTVFSEGYYALLNVQCIPATCAIKRTGKVGGKVLMVTDTRRRLYAPVLLGDSRKRILSIVESTSPGRLAATLRSTSKSGPRDDSEDELAFNASCNILADLVDQQWTVCTTERDIWIAPPPVTVQEGETIGQAKDRLRRGLMVGRDRQLSEPNVHRFLVKMESARSIGGRQLSVKDLIDDGPDLATHLREVAVLDPGDREAALRSLIQPIIQVCSPGKKCPYTGLSLQDIWRYFRHSWSLEYRPTPGRTLQLLIRNQARPNAPVMGIAMLASACTRQRLRDEWIGWTKAALEKKVASGEWDQLQVAQILMTSLEESLTEIRWDDLLTEGEVLHPLPATVKRLRDVAKVAEQRRLQMLRTGLSEYDLKETTLSADWMKASERPLFVKKRAATLAVILEAKSRFLNAGITKDPAHALSTLLGSKSGKWAVEVALAEIRKRRLAGNLLEVAVCGAIKPYNHLLTGKLVTLLLSSAEVQGEYHSRYSTKVSVIASQMAGRPITRSADIMVLTTTSLYGVGSSQYNRLAIQTRDHANLPADLKWNELGTTVGYGTSHLSKDTVDTLRQLSYAVHGVRRINNVFGEGTSPRLRQIREGLDILGLPADDLLRHSTPRIVYCCECIPRARERLLGWTLTPTPQRATISQITEAWIRRWVVRRVERPDVCYKIYSSTSSL